MDLIFIVIGVVSFLLMYCYDFSTVCMKHEAGRVFFPAGAAGLVASTAVLVLRSLDSCAEGIFFAAASAAAVLFALLLIYTLFFALPADEAYSGKRNGMSQVCRTGMYSVCRHPGMLWFAGFYMCTAFALNSAVFWRASIIFIIMDFVYIVLQDLFIFPLQFADYAEYRRSTPFLIPRVRGIRRWGSNQSDGERKRL